MNDPVYRILTLKNLVFSFLPISTVGTGLNSLVSKPKKSMTTSSRSALPRRAGAITTSVFPGRTFSCRSALRQSPDFGVTNLSDLPGLSDLSDLSILLALTARLHGS